MTAVNITPPFSALQMRHASFIGWLDTQTTPRFMKILATFFALLSLCTATRAAIVLTDTFTYPDGSLTNVSNVKWRNTGGVLNQMSVSGGRVELTGTQSEDVDALLAGGPFTASSGVTLYARFTVTFLAPPAGSQGDYFAHYGSSANRCRVFATTNGAANGKFRLGISAGSNAATNKFPLDLTLGQTYTVFTRYTVSNAQCALWINPTAESDLSVVAADTATTSTISTFALREATDIGALRLDDLVVGTSFNEALTGNGAPSIFYSFLSGQVIAAGATTAPFPFTVGDLETPANAITVSASAANPILIPSLILGGSGSNRTLTVTPAADQTGQTMVTLFAFDGTSSNSANIFFSVIPSLLVSEGFNYADGPLITNGSPTWQHHSGTVTGQVQVAGGKLVLSGGSTEDVSTTFPTSQFGTNSGFTHYASLRATFSQPPSGPGSYWAHFNGNTGIARGRIFAGTNNAGPGKFRLGIANGSSTVTAQLALDLSTNTTYRVVLRDNPLTHVSTLWVDPAAESDPGTNAIDAVSGSNIFDFAFREDPGIGTFTVDDLRVGLTFASVMDAVGPALRVERIAPGSARLAWPAAATGFSLQSNTNLATTNWQDVVATPVVTGSENMVTNAPVTPIFFRLKK